MDASGSHNMSVKLDPSNDMQFSVGTGTNSITVNSEMTGGQLGANLDAANTTIAGYMSKLNTFATDFSNPIKQSARRWFRFKQESGNLLFYSPVGDELPLRTCR